MDFSLSNSLVGNAVLGGDGLSLDLQFATDKTLAARKGPTPAFTRGSSATFVGSNGLIQSADNNVARFDHDPVTLACKGLLIEESRTNNCYNSNLLTTASWSIVGVTSATSDTAPDGSSAFEITETLAVSNHSISNSGGATGTPATSITSGVTYTLSVFAKKSTGSIDWIQLTGTGPAFGTAQYANFNLATGAAGNSAGLTSGTTPKIEQFPNGWYRCSMTVTATATAVGNSISINLTNNTNTTTRGLSYLGSTANKVKLAMGQFEAGSFATSYISNVESSGAVRSADVCSISSISSFYAGLGTLFAGSVSNGASSSTGICGFNTSNTIQISINRLPTVVRGQTNGASPSALLISATILPTTFAKTAFAFNTNDAAFATNGVLSATTTSLTLPSVSAFQIGGNGGQILQSGTITEIKYFRKRLSNAKLQALTV